jgi:hypothetical protein
MKNDSLILRITVFAISFPEMCAEFAIPCAV